jgi:hypothetical protein
MKRSPWLLLITGALLRTAFWGMDGGWWRSLVVLLALLLILDCERVSEQGKEGE